MLFLWCLGGESEGLSVVTTARVRETDVLGPTSRQRSQVHLLALMW